MNKKGRVALVVYGDRRMRDEFTAAEGRLSAIASTFAATGLSAEAAVYSDEFVDEVKQQLLGVDGALVWVNPVNEGEGRVILNQMLAEVAASGVFVSAHPDVIAKMGTKEVLHRTRELGWGSDTNLYVDSSQFGEHFPKQLSQGPRVLKLNHGSSGKEVWKLERVGEGPGVRFRPAARGAEEVEKSLDEVVEFFGKFLDGGDKVIDQPYQERIAEGMVRCYLVGDSVAGFGEQLVNALYPAVAGTRPDELPQPGPRLYYPNTREDFQQLRAKLETEWLPAMQELLGIETEELPLIWDADFLYGPKDADGNDTFVLCEINVSAVFPFPDEALQPLAAALAAKLARPRSSR